MKPFAAIIIAAVILAGCGQDAAVNTEALNVVVKKIQDAAVTICSFLPTNESIVKIITASAPGETAYTIAEAICKAVTKADTEGDKNTMGGKDQCPMVAGVCVEGQFVPPPAP